MADDPDDDDGGAGRRRVARESLERGVESALEKAFPRFFETLGIDISSAAARSDFRQDQSYLRNLRLNHEDRSKAFVNKLITAFVGAVIAGVGSWVIWTMTTLAHKP